MGWTNEDRIHYHITIQQLPADTDEAGGVSVDGELQEDTCITLIDDRNEHWAEVRIVRSMGKVV